MKKIMFNDKFGLTRAVLEGRKTMTRRTIRALMNPDYSEIYDWTHSDKPRAYISIIKNGKILRDIFPTYEIGEEVAIAQRYDDVLKEPRDTNDIKVWANIVGNVNQGDEGYFNKMFVRADLMPHRIRITNIKCERLQDISDEDILREGIYRYPIEQEDHDGLTYWESGYSFEGSKITYNTPREAYKALINKVGNTNTWNDNPFTFAYEFELIK